MVLLQEQLSEDFVYNTCANSTSAFSDSESHTFFNSYRSDKFNFHNNVVTRHYHFTVEFDRTCNVSCSDVELRSVTGEERSVTSAFIFCQNVNVSCKFSVRSDRTGSCQYLTSLDFSFINTTEQSTDVVACKTFVVTVVFLVSPKPTISTS